MLVLTSLATTSQLHCSTAKSLYTDNSCCGNPPETLLTQFEGVLDKFTTAVDTSFNLGDGNANYMSKNWHMSHVPNTNLVAQVQINNVDLGKTAVFPEQNRFELVEVSASGISGTHLRVPRASYLEAAPSMVLPSEDGKFIAVNAIHGPWPDQKFDWDFYDVERKVALPPYVNTWDFKAGPVGFQHRASDNEIVFLSINASDFASLRMDHIGTGEPYAHTVTQHALPAHTTRAFQIRNDKDHIVVSTQETDATTVILHILRLSDMTSVASTVHTHASSGSFVDMLFGELSDGRYYIYASSQKAGVWGTPPDMSNNFAKLYHISKASIDGCISTLCPLEEVTVVGTTDNKMPFVQGDARNPDVLNIAQKVVAAPQNNNAETTIGAAVKLYELIKPNELVLKATYKESALNEVYEFNYGYAHNVVITKDFVIIGNYNKGQQIAMPIHDALNPIVYNIPSTQHLDVDRPTVVNGPEPDRSYRIA